jgi:hypothetical protein
MTDARGSLVRIKRADGDAIKALAPWQRVLVLGSLILLCTYWLWSYFLVAVVLLALRAMGVPEWHKEEGWVFGLAFAALFVPLIWLVWPARANRSVARWRVGRGLCGACQYPLAGLEPQKNATQCPECGAWWPDEWLDAKA